MCKFTLFQNAFDISMVGHESHRYAFKVYNQFGSSRTKQTQYCVDKMEYFGHKKKSIENQFKSNDTKWYIISMAKSSFFSFILFCRWQCALPHAVPAAIYIWKSFFVPTKEFIYYKIVRVSRRAAHTHPPLWHRRLTVPGPTPPSQFLNGQFHLVILLLSMPSTTDGYG